MPDELALAVAIGLMIAAILWAASQYLPTPSASRSPATLTVAPTQTASSVPSEGPRPATIIRTYRGRQQADTTAAFQADAAALAREGYEPTSQSWAQGQWGCGAFLVALLLFVVLIGILIFIYMLVVKPEGTLTVTYSLRQVATAPAVAPVEAPQTDTKVCPRCAETIKAAALVCRYCGHEFADTIV